MTTPRPKSTFQVPYNDPISDDVGMLTRTWEGFFRSLKSALEPFDQEKLFDLANNQVAAANIEGLSFYKAGVSQAIVDYLIQRITTGAGATELVTSGTFHLVYKPTSATWALVTMGTPGPSTPGVTLSVTSAGQVQYTSTNVTGTASLSRIVWRSRTMAAKSNLYSLAGRL